MSDILAALTAPRIKEIKVNGQKVFIKSLTVGEQLQAVSSQSKQNEEDVFLNLLSVALCDENGKKLFSKNKNELKNIPVQTVKELFDEIVLHNGMDTEETKQDKKK